MSAHKKEKEEKLNQIIATMTDGMNATLLGIGNDNGSSRNAVIRMACEFLINNKKKFNLK